MKIIGSLFIILLLWASWHEFNTPSHTPEAVHVGVQNDLQDYIRNYLTETAPQLTGINFDKIWTENINKNQMRAKFTYSFVDGEGNKNSVSGSALLNKDEAASTEASLESNDDIEVWSFDKLNIQNNEIAFGEGMTIRSSKASGNE